MVKIRLSRSARMIRLDTKFAIESRRDKGSLRNIIKNDYEKK
jgi:hypothetical protein